MSDHWHASAEECSICEVARLRAELDAMKEKRNAETARADAAEAALRKHQTEPDQNDPDGWIRRSALNHWCTRVVKAEAANAALRDAAGELLEVADLRGDSTLPNPCDDPILWTARAQQAWDDLRDTLGSPATGTALRERLRKMEAALRVIGSEDEEQINAAAQRLSDPPGPAFTVQEKMVMLARDALEEKP